jgi:cellulose synthase/poly-beta-1,6-N-acetylglucosamine synthase-like glycosyltransferase
MQSDVATKAAMTRLRADFSASADSPSINPGTSDESTRRHRELDCIRHLLPADVLAAAQERATVIGTGADRVLIASGAIDEETYLRALAFSLGIAFEPLDAIPRAQCPLADERLISSATAGLLPLTSDDGLAIVVAPRGTAARRIIQLIKNSPAFAPNFRLTSAERFDRFVVRHADKALAARASELLKHDWPLLSAASETRLGGIVAMASIATLPIAAYLFTPVVTVAALEVLLATVFLAWLALRLAGAFIKRRAPDRSAGLADEALPVYTIISALYREAASVEGLLRAIERFDYPAEKLNVILAVEADDRETRAAIAAHKTRLQITVIKVPNAGPRTKPKALNVALPFARGTFTVVYDAEDRPEPQQLRDALAAFRNGGKDLACVQARLCIDNTADSWLARYYTAEYAGQFDVFLPGLPALHLPLPLGGSSNHFYTAVLRKVGAWDPYNVTEDADLGMRLARFGYRADMIASTTYEEAPAQTGAWLRQRTRWFKGWMQTWLVHMREPRRLLRELKLPGFIAFQLMVGGTVFAALVHPLFMGGLIYATASGDNMWHGDNVAIALLGTLYGTTAIIGYFSSAFLGLLGLMRRGLTSTAWVLALTPLHWLLLSLAAWRAVYQLAVAPYAWEKTEHGLAKTSQRAARLTGTLVELERQLSALQESGELPLLADAVPRRFGTRARSHAPAKATYISVDRRLRPRGCA